MERKRKSTDDGYNKSGPSASSAWEPEKLPEPTNGKEEVVKKKKPDAKTTLSLYDDDEEEEGGLFGGGFSTTKSCATKVPQGEEFQLDVKQYVDLLKFAEVDSIDSTPCFVKTKFHEQFYRRISVLRDFGAACEDVYFSGIEGIGKSSTLIHYVLECYKRKDYKVHYVDLTTIESEQKLEEFIAYSKHFKDADCLIIDHITVLNNNLVKKIKQTVKAKLRYILTETGFTASVRVKLTFGKKWQLDEEEFEKIWVRTLKSAPKVMGTRVADRCEEIIGMCKEIYAHFSKEGDLITPRLLNFVWRKMGLEEMSLDEVSFFYESEKIQKIADFVEIKDDSSVYKTLIAHTRYFLHHAKDADYILHRYNFRQLYLAVNVFDVEIQHVTEDNLKNDTRFHNLGFGEGDSYIRISHLIPKYTQYWTNKLPYKFKLVYDESPILLSIMFQNGGVRKEIERLIINFQDKKKLAIIPAKFSETFYNGSSSECKIAQEKNVCFMAVDDFFFVGLDELEQFKSSITDFKFHDKNVAKCAFWIKEKVMQGAFVFYPEIGNLMGVDYFVFLPFIQHSADHSDVAQPKAPKPQKTLLMVQVAMGQKHGGDAIGRALNILKSILSNDVLIHVVVLIASSKPDKYTLSKCHFSNLSVINLAHSRVLITMKKHMLHKYIMKLLGN